jgi:hypothetical protein
MAPKERQIERVHFNPTGLKGILERMSRLESAGDGWINLVPETSEEDEERPTSLGFFTLFGGGATGVTMCTWVPGSLDQVGRRQPSLGITHVTGHRAVTELATRELPVPETWVVEQDHPYRGLVLRLPFEESNERVLNFALQAVRALGTPSPIRRWRADIYLPFME